MILFFHSHGRHHVDKRHACHRDFEQVWPVVEDRTYQQPARRAPFRGRQLRSGPPLLVQSLSAAHKVTEGVSLRQVFALVRNTKKSKQSIRKKKEDVL